MYSYVRIVNCVVNLKNILMNYLKLRRGYYRLIFKEIIVIESV